MRILNLFWHSIESDSISPDYLDGSNPTISIFKQQIEFIVNNYTPISIIDFIRISKEKHLIKSYSKPPVLLGFDDGFKNVINHALPILNKYEIPAVFFVIGEIIKNPDFVPWYVEIKHLLRRTMKKSIMYNNISYDISNKEAKLLLKPNLNNDFKKCRNEKDRQRLLIYLCNLLDVKRPTAKDLDEDLIFINKYDLSLLNSSSLLTVASHGMTHRCLGSLTQEEQVYELEQSNLLLQNNCPSYYPIISYPDGSFNKSTINISKRIYEFGFAVLLGASYKNNFAYPRICLQSGNVQELAYLINNTRINYVLPLKCILHNIGIRRIVY